MGGGVGKEKYTVGTVPERKIIESGKINSPITHIYT